VATGGGERREGRQSQDVKRKRSRDKRRPLNEGATTRWYTNLPGFVDKRSVICLPREGVDAKEKLPRSSRVFLDLYLEQLFYHRDYF